MEVDKNRLNTYHKSKLLCCLSHPDHHVGKKEDKGQYPDDCVYAIERDNGPKDHFKEFSYSDEVQEKFKDFFFDDIADYIRDHITPVYTALLP